MKLNVKADAGQPAAALSKQQPFFFFFPLLSVWILKGVGLNIKDEI